MHKNATNVWGSNDIPVRESVNHTILSPKASMPSFTCRDAGGNGWVLTLSPGGGCIEERGERDCASAGGGTCEKDGVPKAAVLLPSKLGHAHQWIKACLL